MKNILLVMSLSGSVMLLLYALASPLLKKWGSVKWRYGILMIAMGFYLIPFPYFKSHYLELLTNYFSISASLLLNGISGRVSSASVIYLYDHTVYLHKESRELILVLCVLGTISLFLIMKQIFSYIKAKSQHKRQTADPATDHAVISLMDSVKDGLTIQKHVSLYFSDQLNCPMAVGVFSPAILLPSTFRELSPEKLKDIFLHELSHIKHHDLAIKFLALFVAAIHWYNPICYLLYREICCLSEIYCDSVVTAKQSYEERMDYGRMIVDLAARGREDHTTSVSLLGGGKNAIKRRISEMKIMNKKNKTFVSILITLILTITCSFTIFAYQPPLEMVASQPDDLSGEDWIELQTTTSLAPVAELPYDYFFTDKSGNITALTDTNASGRQSCNHTYTAGTATKHQSLSNGGCKITVYDADICIYCKRTVLLGVNYTQEFTTCPH